MRKLLFVYILLIGLFSLYLYSYFSKGQAVSMLGEVDKGIHGEPGERYIMVTFIAGMDYWKPALKGFEDAAKALDVSVEYRGAKQYDPHEQVMVLEQAIARKPAGIAISAINAEALTPTINKAADAGIPIVIFDSGASGSKARTFLGTNNYSAGVTAARKMAELLGGKGQVAVVTQPDQLNHQERTKGFLETIQREYPAMAVAAVRDGKGDELVSRRAAAEILAQYPELKGIFGTEANGGVGIGEAVQALGKDREVSIISFDTDKRTLDMVKDGTIAATLAQGTWNMGYWSLQFLFHLHHNITPSEKDFPKIASMPSYVDTGIAIVTKGNVDSYYAK